VSGWRRHHAERRTPPSGAGTASGWIRRSSGWDIEAEDIKTVIRCPVLAVQGVDDEYGTLEQIRGIAHARAAGTELLELP
jgi:hypothetical protein